VREPGHGLRLAHQPRARLVALQSLAAGQQQLDGHLAVELRIDRIALANVTANVIAQERFLILRALGAG